ncbi:MAG: pyridoxal phosphate-dependent decarboxylase family protein, partial [Acidobacteriota bacterium]
EKSALELEPSPEVRERLIQATMQHGNGFLDKLSELPAYQTTEDKGMALYESPISEQPAEYEKLLELFAYNVVRPGLNPASGGHLGYIPGGGLWVSALADYLAAVTNRYAGVFFSSPGAVRMENMLLDWMADLVGYPSTAAGNLTSGGSIANLMGIVTARDAHELKPRDFHRSAVYLTRQAHHSLDKALRIAGLGECLKRYVPLDKGYRMRPEALDEAIRKDRKEGLLPWLVIASAGTTDTGVVDPLDAIGEIAAEQGLWFHLDGAYGAFFALCPEGRKILGGMGRSDSIVIDPHKGLFLPYGSGAVLVKESQKLLDAHYSMASYLQDTLRSTEELSPADLSPELTKHFRGLRQWLPLKLYGLAPFRAALEEKLLLARYFYREIQTVEGFEVGPYPDLSVVTFRYLPRQGDANAFNQKLIEEVERDGRVFLSSTLLEDRFILRVAVLCFRTHLDTIDETIEVLKEKVRVLESQ